MQLIPPEYIAQFIIINFRKKNDINNFTEREYYIVFCVLGKINVAGTHCFLKISPSIIN